MKTFDIWSEGFATNGEQGGAQKMRAAAPGEDFKDACNKAFAGDHYYDAERGTYWGCRLFDNQVEAIRSFG
jgi:hypothetical protein